MARYRFCSFYLAAKQLAPIRKNDMNNPASDWLVLIRPLVAGFDSTRDTVATKSSKVGTNIKRKRHMPESR
jgi:hypothetical protein